MIIETLDLFATSALAVAAVTLTFHANKLTGQSNKISARNVRLEADKHILEWAKRCLNALSATTSLRLNSHEQITSAEFREKRMALRSEMFALAEEGMLFFGTDAKTNVDNVVGTIMNVTKSLDGTKFVPPTSDDYDRVRRPQVSELRELTRTFVEQMRNHLGDEWTCYQQTASKPSSILPKNERQSLDQMIPNIHEKW
jgi:hypothetical protein